MTPIETAFLYKVLVGAGVLFVIAYVGNLLTFSNRFVNALVTAILFGAIYFALIYFIDRSTLPAEMQSISQDTWIRMIVMASVLVFVIDLIANMMSFSSRFMSALVTAVLFALLFAAAAYFSGGIPSVGTAT